MSFTYEIPRKYRPERLRNKKFLACLKIFHRGSVYLFSPVVKNIKPQCLSVSLLCTGGREGGRGVSPLRVEDSSGLSLDGRKTTLPTPDCQPWGRMPCPLCHPPVQPTANIRKWGHTVTQTNTEPDLGSKQSRGGRRRSPAVPSRDGRNTGWPAST